MKHFSSFFLSFPIVLFLGNCYHAELKKLPLAESEENNVKMHIVLDPSEIYKETNDDSKRNLIFSATKKYFAKNPELGLSGKNIFYRDHTGKIDKSLKNKLELKIKYDVIKNWSQIFQLTLAIIPNTEQLLIQYEYTVYDKAGTPHRGSFSADLKNWISILPFFGIFINGEMNPMISPFDERLLFRTFKYGIEQSRNIIREKKIEISNFDSESEKKVYAYSSLFYSSRPSRFRGKYYPAKDYVRTLFVNKTGKVIMFFPSVTVKKSGVSYTGTNYRDASRIPVELQNEEAFVLTTMHDKFSTRDSGESGLEYSVRVSEKAPPFNAESLGVNDGDYLMPELFDSNACEGSLASIYNIEKWTCSKY